MLRPLLFPSSLVSIARGSTSSEGSASIKTRLRMRLRPVQSVQTTPIGPSPAFPPPDPLRRPHLKAARPCRVTCRLSKGGQMTSPEVHGRAWCVTSPVSWQNSKICTRASLPTLLRNAFVTLYGAALPSGGKPSYRGLCCPEAEFLSFRYWLVALRDRGIRHSTQKQSCSSHRGRSTLLKKCIVCVKWCYLARPTWLARKFV